MGKLCHVFQVHTDFPGYDPNAFKPFRLTLPFIKAIRQCYPDFPNDCNGALAFCEAMVRPQARFVLIKTQEQQAVLTLHRNCAGYVADHTRAFNQLRGLLNSPATHEHLSSENSRHWEPRMVRLKRKSFVLMALLLLIVLGAWKFYRSTEQTFDDDLERFKYGSLGAEWLAGIPYPLFAVLPEVFPDVLEHAARLGWGNSRTIPNSYAAFGLAWEADKPLPVGFSIKQLGYPRVTVNCALCHTTVYRMSAKEPPRFAFGGAGHSVDLQGLFRFLFATANDPRFSSSVLMPALNKRFDLDWIDQIFYRAILIPMTRFGLHVAAGQMAWMDNKPAWGPGRDDAFNLPKYVLTQTAWDDTVGNTDFPALWRLGERSGHLIHSGGEAHSVATVVASSALGTGALPFGDFNTNNHWLERLLSDLPPPVFPGPLNQKQVARGAALFTDNCATCHARGGPRTGSAIPTEEVGTDEEHVRTWQPKDAARMNRVTSFLGMENAELQGAQGYVARPLFGVWLVAPYLHNGAVPTLYDLLTPPAQRPKVFYRGYNVIDSEKVGFVSLGPDAEAHGFRFETQQRGNGNAGHEYGTQLSETDKRALLEFLKTL